MLHEMKHPVSDVALTILRAEDTCTTAFRQQTQRVDVRVVAATHREMRSLVAEGRFREDLFYRLNVIPVSLPPLRDRRSDIAALVKGIERVTRIFG